MNEAWIGFIGVLVGSCVSVMSTIFLEVWKDQKLTRNARAELSRTSLLELQEVLMTRLQMEEFDLIDTEDRLSESQRRKLRAEWAHILKLSYRIADEQLERALYELDDSLHMLLNGLTPDQRADQAERYIDLHLTTSHRIRKLLHGK